MYQQAAAVDMAQEVVTKARALAAPSMMPGMSAMTNETPSSTYTTPRLG